MREALTVEEYLLLHHLILVVVALTDILYLHHSHFLFHLANSLLKIKVNIINPEYNSERIKLISEVSLCKINQSLKVIHMQK